ncbi:MAG: histidine--tRNA ligase [Victivallaceae bacterium]|nr:histidine--tRNA ligase [Victivallaceae bacterium]
MAKSAPPPGTSDIFPAESPRWRFIEKTASEVFSSYNFGELRTPVFEYTEVFHRGLGDETEVVKKEMYTFEDRGGRSLTLRPEGTAGVMRALLNTDVLNGVEQRVFYYGPMFRGERPAAGRRRQFHQIGAECAGRVSPELDAENIAMLMRLLEQLGIPDAELAVNTRGIAADRVGAANLLRDYFSSRISEMCDDCKERLSGNIWRILDCKQDACRKIIAEAPEYLECFTADSKAYFERVLKTLDALGVKYRRDPLLVRGLDYYVHTVFEVSHWGLGGQSAIAGGGRYELFLPGENRPVVGVGFASGVERILMAQDALKFVPPVDSQPLVYLIGLGDGAVTANLLLAAELRKAGLRVECEVESKSMKGQMRTANRLNASAVLITGDDELAGGSVQLRDMAGGEQRTIPRGEAAEECRKIFSQSK